MKKRETCIENATKQGSTIVFGDQQSTWNNKKYLYFAGKSEMTKMVFQLLLLLANKFLWTFSLAGMVGLAGHTQEDSLGRHSRACCYSDGGRLSQEAYFLSPFCIFKAVNHDPPSLWHDARVSTLSVSATKDNSSQLKKVRSRESIKFLRRPAQKHLQFFFMVISR